MAKILYGVHGTGHGQAVRALTIARGLPQHEFLFVSHGTGAAILRPEFPVADCLNPETIIRGHRVAPLPTLFSTLKIRWHYSRLFRQVLDLIERFQPDVTLSDYEYFVPRAARQAGVPCLSLDHQHIITCCPHPVPWGQYPSYLTTYSAVGAMFSAASDFMAVSFFRPAPRPGARVKIVPPLFRESVLARQPREGCHVVAYQGYTTFARFFPFLQAIPSQVVVYGFNESRTQGNLVFKKTSEAGFLDDLSSCRYVVCGGSHTLISEALYYGKPVISFPIKGAFEQFLNAFYLDRLGYGSYFTGLHPRPEIIPAFESRLDSCRQNIRRGYFYGNPEIFALVEHFIREKTLPYP